MLNRSRILFVTSLFAALVLGIGLGAGGALLYSGKLVSAVLLEMKALELLRSEDAAMDACRSQRPETAIWALERHLKLIGDLKEISYPPQSLELSAILTHARLAKLYDSLGKADKKQTHVQSAIAVASSANSPGLRKITSEEGLFAFLTGVDDPSRRDDQLGER